MLVALVLLVAACAVATAVVVPPPPRATETATPTVPGVPGRAASLVGDSSAEVTARFGPPSLRRNEGDAEYWLYSSARGCRVEILLYRNGASETVAHATTALPPHFSEAACLREIAGARGLVPAI
jgi:hypothetical protein